MPSTAAPTPLMRDAWRIVSAGVRQGWASYCFLVSGIVVSVVQLGVALLVGVGLSLIPLLGLGLVIAVPAMFAVQILGMAERSRMRALLGARLLPPAPVEGSWFQRVPGNENYWKHLAHTVIAGTWGLVVGSALLGGTGFAVRLCVSQGIAMVTSSGVGARLSAALLVLAGCAAVLVVAPVAARGLTWVNVWLGRTLISGNADEEISELTARVTTLTLSREQALDSVAMERRRIERDLHDGPQQRLTAIAMDLGVALSKIESDPDKAQEIVKRAHVAAKEATTELRQVIRGIHPPILTDRGLGPALSALAARCPLEVSVESGLPFRAPAPLEAIAYFCVSEALTNATKHSGAKNVWVVVKSGPDQLIVSVTDDGVGGAKRGVGSGLTGLDKRISAVDGVLTVQSPPGGPTVLTFTFPWVHEDPNAPTIEPFRRPQ